MNDPQALHLCMGSACHQLGGYRLIPILQALLHEHGLQEQVQLKGAFCLETCNLGRSLQFRDKVLTGLNENNIRDVFEREILPVLLPDRPASPATPQPPRNP